MTVSFYQCGTFQYLPKNLGAPTLGSDATNKTYVDSAIAVHAGITNANPHGTLTTHITDFATGVSNNSSVSANTTHRGITSGNPHGTLTTHITDFATGVSNNLSVSANTTHRGITRQPARDLTRQPRKLFDAQADWGGR
eukprot:g74501.t1